MRSEVKKHPAYRAAVALFACIALLIFIADYYPTLKNLQLATTIAFAFVAPLLMIYAAARSAHGASIQLLITFLLAMIIVLTAYGDIYVRSGMVIDVTDAAVQHAITTRTDGLYFSVVTWTTLGYGDLQPRGFCRLVAASEALIGNIFLGSFIGLLFSFLTRERNEIRSNQTRGRVISRDQ